MEVETKQSAKASAKRPPSMRPRAAIVVPAVQPWYVYMIECRGGSIYTGIAVDVAARYAMHACGKGARYTRAYPPVRLIAVVAHAHRSAALKAEHALKKLTPRAKRAFAASFPA